MKKLHQLKIGWILPFVAGSMLFSFFLFFLAVCFIFELPVEYKIAGSVLPVVLFIVCIWGARRQMDKKREKVHREIEAEQEAEKEADKKLDGI